MGKSKNKIYSSVDGGGGDKIVLGFLISCAWIGRHVIIYFLSVTLVALLDIVENVFHNLRILP
jgi:hypothetical protein